MSSNDGGDPIRLSKEPVEKPPLPRGFTLILRPRDAPRAAAGDKITVTVDRSGFRITMHDVTVDFEGEAHTSVNVRPDTVITWERLSDLAPQI
jgi:hypothetical protein